MRTVRPASFDEFIAWYLQRDDRKRGKDVRLPAGQEAHRTLMNLHHGGKLRHWFPAADWSIVELQSEEDLMRLVCLASDWTRASNLLRDEGAPNSWLLKTFVLNATQTNYFGESDRPTSHPENMEKRRLYVSRLRADSTTRFSAEDRIVLCSLSPDEKRRNPAGTFYLHDGLGRMLAYTYLISRSEIPFSPVEAFLAELTQI